MTVDVIQFLRPDGRQILNKTELADRFLPDYEEMTKDGCKFEAEILQTGMVSVTISSPELGEDLDIKVVENSPAVQSAMEEMLETKTWQKTLVAALRDE